MTNEPMSDQAAWNAGWYYDPLHQQPVCLFWCDDQWWGRFVWHELPPDAATMREVAVQTQDTAVTFDMYHRLIRLQNHSAADYISRGGSALRDTHGVRALVQVKLASDGRGVCIQAPTRDTQDQHDPRCDAIWLADDEIPMVIRALQARRRAALDSSESQ